MSHKTIETALRMQRRLKSLMTCAPTRETREARLRRFGHVKRW